MPEADLKKLHEWEEHFGGRIKARTLREEVRKGNLRAIRVTASCNAPILVSARELDRWLNEVAAKRSVALSPREVSSIRKEVALSEKGA